MKVLKYILLSIILLIGIALIAAALLPKQYTISESIIIKKPLDSVYNYVRFFENQKEYSVWILNDKTTKINITGTDGEIGATQHWDGKESGVGIQKITSLSKSKMEVDLIFTKPFESNQKAANLFKMIDSNTTKLTSEYYGNDKFPFTLLSHLFGIKIIKDAELQNLKNIKAILEKR